MNKKLLTFFIILILGCSVFYYLIIKYNGFEGNGNYVLGLMWVPAFSALITKIIYDKSIKNIGWKFCGFKAILISYFLPLIACIIVYGTAWFLNLGKYQHIYSFKYLIIYSIVGIFISCISAVGEEIGWRGFLLSELKKSFNYPKLCLIIGIIWFVYHVPVILFSTYNNGNVAASTICFFFMVLAMTSIANYICLKTNSFWPGAILHASHNLFVQTVFDKMTVNGPYTQYLTSEFGIGLALVYGIIAVYLIVKFKKRKIELNK